MRNRILPVYIHFTLAILACIPSLAPSAGAQSKYNVLYSFTGGTDGGGVWDSVVFDTKGNLYGTTSGGGAYGYGTVFELSPTTQGPWTETVLHSFPYPSSDGAEPNGNVILDAAGNLYGTTQTAGANGRGTIFEMTPGSSGWTFNVLYNFGSQSGDGGSPSEGLTLDKAGNLYGTSGVVFGTGGCFGGGCGIIFKLTRGAHGGWVEAILYRFQAGTDGFSPQAGVVLDHSGNLYGTTLYGGSASCGCGVVYKLAPSSSGTWTYSVLHAFVGTDGSQPVADLTLHNGKLFGTTIVGGPSGVGTVFEVAL